ncbi:hypothetical protein ALC57_03253, partial [Trachymyrmex cornetzi]
SKDVSRFRLGGTMSLTKRIDEIRLLESRKSARLADQDTDFARLADMAGGISSSFPITVAYLECFYVRGSR